MSTNQAFYFICLAVIPMCKGSANVLSVTNRWLHKEPICLMNWVSVHEALDTNEFQVSIAITPVFPLVSGTLMPSPGLTSYVWFRLLRESEKCLVPLRNRKESFGSCSSCKREIVRFETGNGFLSNALFFPPCRLLCCCWKMAQTPMLPTSLSPLLFTEPPPRATTASSSCFSSRVPQRTSKTRRATQLCMCDTVWFGRKLFS